MLTVHVTNDRTNWLWRVEVKLEGVVLLSRVAHSLEELACVLFDASLLIEAKAKDEDTDE